MDVRWPSKYAAMTDEAVAKIAKPNARITGEEIPFWMIRKLAAAEKSERFAIKA